MTQSPPLPQPTNSTNPDAVRSRTPDYHSVVADCACSTMSDGYCHPIDVATALSHGVPSKLPQDSAAMSKDLMGSNATYAAHLPSLVVTASLLQTSTCTLANRVIFFQVMEHFPQELIDHLCGYLGAEDVRNAYYVSVKFRKAAEDHAGTYRDAIWLLIDEVSVYKQRSIEYYSGFRLRYLQEVLLCFQMPRYSNGKDYGCRENIDEQREKDEFFTCQLQALWTTLRMVEGHAGERNRGSYRLTIVCPFQKIAENTDDCLHREHAQWRTHLLRPETLPILESVTSFCIEDDYKSFSELDYRILVDLTTRFPNLKDLTCRLGADEWTPSLMDEQAHCFIWEYDGPRRDSRHDFGRAIISAKIPPNLRRVELDFISSQAMDAADYIDHRTSMPNLVSPALHDPFSTSLRILSYHLVKLTLRAQLDKTLFWPEDQSTPAWPNLQRLSVMFHMVSPSGVWYFEGPRGEGGDLTGYELDASAYPPLETTEEDKRYDGNDLTNHRSFQDTYCFWFRISPNDDILGPFLASFAKAAANMPKLEQAVLWSPLRWDIDGGQPDEREPFDYFDPPEHYYENGLAWGLAYNSPGMAEAFSTKPGEANCAARQMWWKVGEWRPNPEIHDLFQKIGRGKHGNTLKEYWEDEKFGQDLVDRDIFECWTPGNDFPTM
ncbi:hypothetical protein CC86DRAFT_459023 [Ophiobolus disseminans]|uniref:F-box domain-containing protein n=1 Tax=Ophiobolus disseminans TaxID=1469910 RepID=A0A6A6ZKQ7_9PLEO|nr:hypothetical protein CC86DRAFT_459023 [Ophiobolus disseminans]